MFQIAPEQAFRMAYAHHQAGRYADAEALYRQVLAAQANHSGATHLLGVLAAQTGRLDEAIALLRRAVVLAPTDPGCRNNLGKLLGDKGLHDEAAGCYREALRLKPDFADAHNNLACALKAQGHLTEAIAEFEQAIHYQPAYVDAHNNLGIALATARRFDEAISAYRAALKIKPDFVQAYSNMSLALQAQGRADEAIEACREAIRVRPDFADAHGNLGNMLAFRNEFDEAIAEFQLALRLNPHHADALNNLANALKETGQIEQALPLYRQAAALRPSDGGLHSNIILALQYHPESTQESLFQEARNWAQRTEPLSRGIAPHANDRSPDRPLRIGYVSADFRSHAVGRNILPLFAHHDHQQFHITCFSDVMQPDAFTKRFQTLADQWHSIVGFPGEQVAQLVRKNQIDILVDLAVHTGPNRLLVFARKPAPVQFTFAGYPGTTGLSTIDYRLTDPYLDSLPVPGSQDLAGSFYSETSIRLPHSFWCYSPPPDEAQPEVNAVPAFTSGKITFGCLNSFAKINAGVLELWGKVLSNVPNSRLMLRASAGRHRQNTLDILARHEITPDRIEFQGPRPHSAYMELYHQIDIALDTLPYNAHTTALDALWMGVPVVTLVGKTIVGRAGLSQLSNLGLTELIAYAPEQFVRIAAELADDLPRLTELRATLRQRMQNSPLTDAPSFAKAIEDAYRSMWQKWYAR